MLTLAIESSTAQVGCAVGGHEGVLASAHSARGRHHAESLAPMIEFVCDQARVELSELSCVAVDVGPGLFTGLRVGVATATAMASVLRVPMIGISSLDLLAFPVRFTDRLIVVAIDARRGELFHASYRQVSGGVQRLSEARVCTPEGLAAELVATNDEVLLVGDGARRYEELFSEVQKVERESSHPMATALAQLAHAQALSEEFVKPSEIQPIYLRRPDAEINWTTRDQV
ncbi:MAG: tRNA (adenosine(37)-N6)-threonylcarbamoyltransferase complex dimerization subunit type 1 TsaB [Actinomycetia bacterium]|nr:tRNA (adenosine(37)-N6)-threonylcarbamoyltransferase complex dimerization subunit type 1 TsaB [Actinomycetes bacterium]